MKIPYDGPKIFKRCQKIEVENREEKGVSYLIEDK